jgi:hypothetical protein
MNIDFTILAGLTGALVINTILGAMNAFNRKEWNWETFVAKTLNNVVIIIVTALVLFVSYMMKMPELESLAALSATKFVVSIGKNAMEFINKNTED